MPELVTGVVREKQARYRTKPKWQSLLSLGIDDRFPTSFKIYVQGATLQYPQVSLKIAMSNSADHSCFCTTSITELTQLMEWISQCIDELNKVMPQLLAEEALVREQEMNFSKMQELYSQLGIQGVSAEQLQNALTAIQGLQAQKPPDTV